MFQRLGTAQTAEQYQSIVSSSDVERIVGQVGIDYQELGSALNASPVTLASARPGPAPAGPGYRRIAAAGMAGNGLYGCLKRKHVASRNVLHHYLADFLSA